MNTKLWHGAAGSFGVMLLVVVLDVITGRSAVLIGLLGVGPLLASLNASRRLTITAAVAAAAAAIPLGAMDGIFATLDHAIRISVVVLAGVIAVQATQQRERREEASRQLQQVVEVAQEIMLRPPPKQVAHVALAAHYVSASDVANVGGDLYETAYTSAGVRLIMGDVRGKGLEAVRLAATVLAAFRESIWEPDLCAVVEHLNEQVRKTAADEEFVTVVLVEIPNDGPLRLVNLGHHPPLRLTRSGVEELQTAAPTVPLGMEPDPVLEHFEFAAGDRLLLFTDGLVEARDEAGEFFPLRGFTEALRNPDLQLAVNDLVAGVMHHVPGRLPDDMAILLAERLADS